MFKVLTFIFVHFPLLAHGSVRIERLRGHEAVVANYCATQTSPQFSECGADEREEKLDVIYFPKDLGEKVVDHIQSAFQQKFFENIDRDDFYHGHPISGGPMSNYGSTEAYFSDLKAILYHSAEDLRSWRGPGVTKERSFVGFLQSAERGVRAAIDLITPNVTLKSYKDTGTIYAEELNASLKLSAHQFLDYGSFPKITLNTCLPEDVKCTPCRLEPMVHIFENPKGRFLSPAGQKIEIFLRCLYRRSGY